MKNLNQNKDDFEQNLAPCDRLFGLFPIEKIKGILTFPLGSIAMRTALQKCIQDHSLIISKSYLHHEVSMMQLCDQNGISIESKPFSNQARDVKQPILLPETDLWDAALLDFYMYVIEWSSTQWIEMVSEMQIENDVNKLSFLKDAYQTEEANLDKSELAVCFGLATVYLLLKSLQLWQKDYLLYKSDMEDDRFNDGVSSIVGSIDFIKHLLQSKPSDVPGENKADQQVDGEILLWKQLSIQYTGLLNILKEEVVIILIDFLTVHVLHKHLLLERLFGLVTTRKQEQLDVCCALELSTLPKVFGSTTYQWPPPLSQSIPLDLVATYPELFEEQVTRWLPCLAEDEDVPPVEDVILEDKEPEPPEVIEETALVVEEEKDTTDNRTELYLLLLKLLQSEELVLLSGLTEDEVTSVVLEVVQSQASVAVPHQELLAFQSQLASQLVQAAQEQTKGREAD